MAESQKSNVSVVAWMEDKEMELAALTPETLRKPNLVAKLYPNMIGCLGFCTNPLGDIFLQHILKSVEDRIFVQSDSSFADNGAMKCAYRGTLPEFADLCKADEAVPAQMVLRYLKNQALFQHTTPEGMVPSPPIIYQGWVDFMSEVNYANYSLTVAEKDILWFTADGGTFYVMDLHPHCGQIFFAPTVNDFQTAIQQIADFPSGIVIIEFPTSQIWRIQCSPNAQDYDWNVKKFKITKTKYYEKE